MQSLRKLLDGAVMFVCVVLFIEMTIIGTYQIVTRYFFNSPSTVSEEIVTYSFTWLSVLAAAYVFGKRGHLAMTFLSAKFTGKPRIFLDMFSEILVILTAVALLLYGGYVMVTENMDQVTNSLTISMGLVYAILPLSGAIILLYGIMNILDMFKALGSPDVDKYGAQQAD
ncbi:MAG: TRAP transporter small permease [Succinivibrio sp.]|nr:TRAP transporter small permease [Succinivibrio sp.]